VKLAMAEREVLLDAVNVGFMNERSLAQAAEALGVFSLGQVTAASAMAQDLAGGGDFKPLGHGLSSFNAFGTSHKFCSIAKERRR
jgi:hypothetical protein